MGVEWRDFCVPARTVHHLTGINQEIVCSGNLNPKDQDHIVKVGKVAISNKQINKARKKEGGQFIPYPATWINGRRWEDEVTEPPTQSAKDSPPYWQEVN